MTPNPSPVAASSSVYFFDSSALAKRYIAEKGSAWVESITDPAAGNFIYVARITAVEVAAALNRRERKGDLTATDAKLAFDRLRNDFITQYQTIEISPILIEDAMYAAGKHNLRGYDAVQLTAAIEVNDAIRMATGTPITFVVADADLINAGRIEGMFVENAENH